MGERAGQSQTSDRAATLARCADRHDRRQPRIEPGAVPHPDHCPEPGAHGDAGGAGRHGRVSPRSAQMKVLLTTDGTYPCYTGGVSVWCDQLVRHSPDVTFRIFALTYSPIERPVYAMPANVEAVQILPLWGVKEAGWAEG